MGREKKPSQVLLNFFDYINNGWYAVICTGWAASLSATPRRELGVGECKVLKGDLHGKMYVTVSKDRMSNVGP